MQLSSFTDYTLRVLLHLAAAQDQKLTTRQITEAQNVKFNHLAKVTQWLVREGYASSTRGRAGGLMLLRDPSTITVGEIVRALEKQDGLVECMQADGGNCILSPICELKGTLNKAQEAFYATLDKQTIAALVDKKMYPLLKRLNRF